MSEIILIVISNIGNIYGVQILIVQHLVISAMHRQCINHYWQVELILKLGSDILGDLHSYKRFQQEATELLDELRTWQQDAFAEWSRDVLTQIDDPNAPLR